MCSCACSGRGSPRSTYRPRISSSWRAGNGSSTWPALLGALDAERAGSVRPRPADAEPAVAPDGDHELYACEIFRELLGIEEIGAEDDFFALGGDSLLATDVVGRVRRRFDVSVRVTEFLAEPTPRRSRRSSASRPASRNRCWTWAGTRLPHCGSPVSSSSVSAGG